MTRRFLPLSRPVWDWLQVEVTTACNASCRYCPRTVLHGLWQNNFLSWEDFLRLKSVLSRTRLVHLQGWGEPFLHPKFFEMAALAKSSGCLVGTTTNGMLLDRAALQRLVDLQLDTVAFSLAGTGADHDYFRPGTSLETVLETIAELSRLKKAAGSVRPAVHIAYMLLKSGIEGLPYLSGILKGLDVSQVVVSTLDFLSDPGLSTETLIPANENEYRELSSLLDALAEDVHRQGIKLHYRLQHPWRKSKICLENIARAAVVTADAQVSACVFENLPLAVPAECSPHDARAFQRRIWGSLRENTLDKIWADPRYRAFRQSFQRGRTPLSCQSCLKMNLG